MLCCLGRVRHRLEGRAVPWGETRPWFPAPQTPWFPPFETTNLETGRGAPGPHVGPSPARPQGPVPRPAPCEPGRCRPASSSGARRCWARRCRQRAPPNRRGQLQRLRTQGSSCGEARRTGVAVPGATSCVRPAGISVSESAGVLAGSIGTDSEPPEMSPSPAWSGLSGVSGSALHGSLPAVPLYSNFATEAPPPRGQGSGSARLGRMRSHAGQRWG